MDDEEKQAPADVGASETDQNGCSEAALAEAERKVGEFRDQALRAHAELENTRKRTDKEIGRIRKYALESFALEMLVVKDNLERGLGGSAGDNADEGADVDTVEHLREGVRLTLKLLEQAFAKFGIEEVSPAGQIFDPELHQAMSTLETSEHASNTVIEVVQKGYLLHDRLLRPAMVVVSALPPGADKGGAGQPEKVEQDGM